MTEKNERLGACLSAAYDDIMHRFKDLADRNEIIVVHGWVYSYALKRKMKHAWLEWTSSGIVYEPVNQVILDHEDQKKFKMIPVKRYTLMEIIKLSLKTKMKGGIFEF